MARILRPRPRICGGGLNMGTRITKAVIGCAILIISGNATAQMTSGFGSRTDPFHGKMRNHSGVDLASPTGTPIRATADAYVGRAEKAGGYGNLVELNHGRGYQTRYAHMHKILVRPGQYVRRGTVIGLVGSTGRSTGPHLHYEVRFNGKAIDPTPFMKGRTRVAVRGGSFSAGRVAMGGAEE